MAIGFLGRGVGGRSDVRHEQRRLDGAGRLAQVAVVPGRMDAAVAIRWLGRIPAVPAHAEAVAVGGGGAQARMQALVDKRMPSLENHGLEFQRTTGISHPAAHKNAPADSSRWGYIFFSSENTRYLQPFDI